MKRSKLAVIMSVLLAVSMFGAACSKEETTKKKSKKSKTEDVDDDDDDVGEDLDDGVAHAEPVHEDLEYGRLQHAGEEAGS
ncbi:MAG: hypothetical protein IK020_10460, partial [Clostridiales bacterium]|nr:hypothetical protein [Clostridiales bacterium]